MSKLLALCLLTLLAGCAPSMADNIPSGVIPIFPPGIYEWRCSTCEITVEWHCVEWQMQHYDSKRIVETFHPESYVPDDKRYWQESRWLFKGCVREIGFVSDNTVIWRRPPQELRDAAERTQKSLPYK